MHKRTIVPRSGGWVVADALRRPLARFGISTRTRPEEDIQHAVQFTNFPELHERAAQVIAETEAQGLTQHAGVLLQRLREAVEACAVPVPGLDGALPAPAGEGECVATEGRTAGQIAAQLRQRIGGAAYVVPARSNDTPWPADARLLACYAVSGGSAGHYVHVDALDLQPDGPSALQPLVVIKVLAGREHALAVASLCARLLRAV